MSCTSPSNDEIAQRAYALWEQAGRPAGLDQDFWLRAEAELAASASATTGPPVIAPPVAPPLPAPTASPTHPVPPPFQSVAETPARRAPRPRASKRT